MNQFNEDVLNVFPSPLGVSYFQILFITGVCVAESEFPSPLGVSYFQIITKIGNNIIDDIVSVPSRGILFPNTASYHFGRASGMLSFRPLSGYLISKWKNIFYV